MRGAIDRDATRLAPVFADDLIWVTDSGTIMDKKAAITRYMSELKEDSIRFSEIAFASSKITASLPPTSPPKERAPTEKSSTGNMAPWMSSSGATDDGNASQPDGICRRHPLRRQISR